MILQFRLSRVVLWHGESICPFQHPEGIIVPVSSLNGTIPCLGKLTAGHVTGPEGTTRQAPACDFAEARVWEALGGGWQCLYGCFCQCGVSIEWHDFACSEPRDWSRSFHPDSVEVCLNISGHARLTCGENSALLGPLTAGLYHAAEGELAAWRLPEKQH